MSLARRRPLPWRANSAAIPRPRRVACSACAGAPLAPWPPSACRRSPAGPLHNPMTQKFLKFCDAIGTGFRRFILRRRSFSLPADTKVEAGVDLRAGAGPDGRPGAVQLGAGCQLSCGAVLHAYGGRIVLGPDVFVGP